jgi:hypothetical protein
MDQQIHNINGTLFSINELTEMYLDWFNNFLTIGAFSTHYRLPEETALKVIKVGREMHERKVFYDLA